MSIEQERALLPCPFCGGANIEIQISTPDREGVPTNLMCSDCGASGPWEYEQGNSHAKADDAWNRRAALQSQKPKPNNLMLSAVIRMPFEMAMADPISRMQFYQRSQQALNELEALQSQDREDAERYRWLRNTAQLFSQFEKEGNSGWCVMRRDSAITRVFTYNGQELDGVIDHARRVEESDDA